MINSPSYNFIFKAIDIENLMLSGYASVFGNVDMHNDIIMPKAFEDSIAKHKTGQNTIKLLWQHQHAEPIGIIKDIYEDAHGVFINAQLTCQTTKGKEAIALVKQKAIDSFSIGFQIKRFEFNEQGQRQITQAELWEVSIVTFPANLDARITSCKNSAHQINVLEKAKSTFIY